VKSVSFSFRADVPTEARDVLKRLSGLTEIEKPAVPAERRLVTG
jgi:hypothetical protein